MSLAATLEYLRFCRDEHHRRLDRDNVELRKIVGERTRVALKIRANPFRGINKEKIRELLSQFPTVKEAAKHSGLSHTGFRSAMFRLAIKKSGGKKA